MVALGPSHGWIAHGRWNPRTWRATTRNRSSSCFTAHCRSEARTFGSASAKDARSSDSPSRAFHSWNRGLYECGKEHPLQCADKWRRIRKRPTFCHASDSNRILESWWWKHCDALRHGWVHSTTSASSCRKLSCDARRDGAFTFIITDRGRGRSKCARTTCDCS